MNERMKKSFQFQTDENNIINLDLWINDKKNNLPIIILVHGFKGFKDWGFFPYTAKFLNEKGFNILSFNFSHNGVGNSIDEFDQLDKFEKNSISLEVSELNQVLNKTSEGFFTNYKPLKLGLLGHSRGGGVSILCSSKNHKVNSLCCWAPVCRFDRYTNRQKIEWRKKGYFEVLNTRTNQIMRMSLETLDDIEKNKYDKHNIEKAVKLLTIPFFIIHGEQDLTVNIKESEQIYKWSNKNLTRFEKIESAGHTFGIAHPFSGTNKYFDKILNLTADFFIKSLNFNITN
jgi:esterase/lipase